MTTTKKRRGETCLAPTEEVKPLCPVFDTCGGCDYQHLPYDRELKRKQEYLKNRFHEELGFEESIIANVVPSPKPYHYRNRLDLTLRRSRGELIFGFQSIGTKRMIPIDTCAIAREEISSFLPELSRLAKKKMPEKYRTANLVIKTGDDGRLFWGGIGRRSLQMAEEDYFWTEIHGTRIFYSLDTFFQANSSILESLMETISQHAAWDPETLFLDLYAGVGLFGVYFADQVKRTVMVEEVKQSNKLMDFNLRYHRLENAENICGRVEEALPRLLAASDEKRKIAMIDPPRRGLSAEVLETLVKTKDLEKLFYLSCHPESLIHDLKGFLKGGWRVQKVIPFDFFPKTRHLETLVQLIPGRIDS